MHYKGKKHAKVMYMKRSKDSKHAPHKRSYSYDSTQTSTSPNSKTDAEDSRMLPENDTQQRSYSDTATLPVDNGSHFSSFPVESSVFTVNVPAHAEHRLPNINNEMPIAVPVPINPDPIQVENPTSETASSFEDTQRGLSEDVNNSGVGEALSPSNMDADYTGSAEDDLKVKGLPQREPVVLPDPLPRYISRIEKPSVLKESLRCTVCDIYVNSENQMRQHVNSLRHKNIEKGIPTPPKPAKDDKPKGKAEQFRCEVCRVTLNSDIQLLQHLSSQRHKNMLEGKPPKPRWSPYERTQHALLRSAAQIRLSLKAIPGGRSHVLLTSPIPTSTAALQVGGHGTLRPSLLAPPAAGPAHLKQMAYLAPNGSILQTREVIYIGAAPPRFTGTPQPQLTAPGQILQSPFPGVHPELTSVLNTPCVSLDPREIQQAYNWNA